ncbi:L,D-transpeptidase [Gaetbulibacter sp. M235]|uniref:L,D-transpeptidase n=1 Tax=Gaetbulibacter sp. M235 TaxID=3126510 RepID=UPI00374F4524
MLSKLFTSLFLIIVLLVFIIFHNPNHKYSLISSSNIIVKKDTGKLSKSVLIDKSVTVGSYFQFLDSVIKKYDSVTPYVLTEHLLVRANPWIIDRLKNTDYYIMKTKGSFVYNQKDMLVFNKNDILVLPDLALTKKLLQSFEKTYIDVNIPEFKLRIFEDSSLLYEFPIRVGQLKKKYLKMANREIDLKTKTGSGFIVNYVRYPDYYNPVDGHKYFVTKRDDGNVTKMPQIPFIETEINGIRNGQLIHATTNPNTLGKAYSNGCIGAKEADTWVIYYYAAIGTKINIRYDLNVVDSLGKKIVLKDIYKNYKLNN